MIQAFTQSTFDVYISTEDNRIDTSVTANKIRHLFKFINDMDGCIQYAYGATEVIYNRYTTLSFLYSTTPDMYAGETKLLPAGHYKYEVYEVSWIGTPTLAVSTAPATEIDVLPVSDSNGVVQGIVTKGILNVTEKVGTEQVQYTQHETADECNYIWYGADPVASFDCVDGSCVDPGTGDGAYSTIAACNAACGVTPSWDCIDGSCLDPGTGVGAYASLSACNAACSAANAFTFSVNTANTSVSSSSSSQYQLPLVDAGTINMIVYWGDGIEDTITSYNQAETLHTYTSPGTYTITIRNEVRGWRQFQTPAALYNDSLKILDISKWGEFNVTEDITFHSCGNLTGTATDAPTISSTSLRGMFTACPVWDGAMNSWDVSSVTDMGAMFGSATTFNQPLNLWDVSRVTNMGGMFGNATLFNQNIGGWNTISVTDIATMFNAATAFDQDISGWDVRNVIVATGFFNSSGLSTANYDLLLVLWDAQTPVASSLTIGFGTSRYTSGGVPEASRTNLIDIHGWAITDGGVA